MSPAHQVTEYINQFLDWRGERLKELRDIINEAAPEAHEEFKWNVPVWTQNGLLVAISAFRDHVKVNFFKGVHLPDPKHVINGGMESKEHRSIDFKQADKVNIEALSDLVKAAIEYNKE
jgi:hypothetical protein